MPDPISGLVLNHTHVTSYVESDELLLPFYSPPAPPPPPPPPQVKDFGVEVADGAGDDALTATALLLFGPGGQSLPGGYDTNEMSRWVLSYP